MSRSAELACSLCCKPLHQVLCLCWGSVGMGMDAETFSREDTPPSPNLSASLATALFLSHQPYPGGEQEEGTFFEKKVRPRAGTCGIVEDDLAKTSPSHHCCPCSARPPREGAVHRLLPLHRREMEAQRPPGHPACLWQILWLLISEFLTT